MKLFARIKRWLATQLAEDDLEECGICPKHRVEYKFDRWIGTYCIECLLEKGLKKEAREAKREEYRLWVARKAMDKLDSLRQAASR
ncbi:MAG TPA: hypothetical protein VMW15_10170 [Terracidiphilus sp.]|nr:hypothetical protein [Terracidiphilus sp.]